MKEEMKANVQAIVPAQPGYNLVLAIHETTGIELRHIPVVAWEISIEDGVRFVVPITLESELMEDAIQRPDGKYLYHGLKPINYHDELIKAIEDEKAIMSGEQVDD